MADIALYRKYRPQNFENLVGQEAIQRTLLNAIKSGHLSHAYLFCGPRGTGKTTSARLVAKAINCIAPLPSGESCNQCEYCQLMNQGRLVDLIEIDAASNRGIDEIRDLREKIKFSPTQAPHKIYIIDEVHMLTKEAFNALLKTLEEPPKHAYFILATTEVHKIPDTIISRCQRFDFRRMSQSTLVERLRHIARQEQIEVEDEALELIARSSEGGMRDAIGLLEQLMSNGSITTALAQSVLGVTGPENVHTLYQHLEANDLRSALGHLQELHRDGVDLNQFNRDFLALLREKMLEAVQRKEPVDSWLRWIEAFQGAAQASKHSVLVQLPLEMAVIQCLTTPRSAEKSEGGWLSGWMSKKEEVAPKTQPSSTSKEPPPPPAAAQTVAPAKGLKPLPEEAAPANTPLSEWSLEALRKEFPRIVDLIKTPSFRLSFKTGWIRAVEQPRIEIEFQSKFHLSKIDTTVAKSEIESAFSQRLGSKPVLSFHLTESAPLVDNPLDSSLEILGGELIE